MNTELACKSFRYDNIEGWFEMMIKCTEFPSVNSAHGINTRTKVVFDQPWVIQFRSEIRDQMIFADPRKHCPWITDTQVYYLYIKYIIKQYFWSRDLDNMVKIFQDEIAGAMHINDSHIIEGHQYKCFMPGDYEYAIIRVGISKHNYNEFNQG